MPNAGVMILKAIYFYALAVPLFEFWTTDTFEWKRHSKGDLLLTAPIGKGQTLELERKIWHVGTLSW